MMCLILMHRWILSFLASFYRHSFGSGHTHQSYNPPVDTCGSTCPSNEMAGLPLPGSSGLMSYCHQCS